MNPLANKLNSTLIKENENIFNMLSSFGRELFFPKGILSQSKEASEKADKFNATIGIAMSGGDPIYLPSIRDCLPSIAPKDIFPYVSVGGKDALREIWRDNLFIKNPSLSKNISKSIVTAGVTNAISVFSDLFVDKGDIIIIPDKFWGNYKHVFGVRHGARILNYPLFNSENGFNLRAFEDAVLEASKTKNKLIMLFNFPNNPTGYTINEKEALGIRKIIERISLEKDVIVLTDDSYFGLFYEDTIKESFFSYVADLRKNILAVKLDGGTKEDYIWGFRVGFITFSVGGPGDKNSIYNVFEEKVKGAIRSSISSSSSISQTLLLKALQDVNYSKEKASQFAIISKKALKSKEVLKNPKYSTAWETYPFNSGYFLCLFIKDVLAEDLRVHLLDKYGVGVVASGKYDLRIAFAGLEERDIEELFEIVYQGVCDLQET